MFVSLLTPMALFVPVANAAADTCTWVGASGAEDTVAKTWTFNVTDAANWAGCDNGNVPEAGDSLVFPANLADVDPDDSETDDWSWKYIVNNDLPVDSDINGIVFSADTGTDCQVYDDKYTIAGNSISLSGDIEVTTTGTCTYNTSAVDMSITTTADVKISTGIEDQVSPFTVNTLTFGANALSFCDLTDGTRLNKSLYPNNLQLTGTGTVTIACGTFSLQNVSSNTFGNVIVENGSSISGPPQIWGYSAANTFTFKDNATFSFNDYSVATQLEFLSDIVFEGTGGSSAYCTSTACTGAAYVQISDYRGYIANSSGGYEEPTVYHKTVFSGDVTLVEDTTLGLSSNVDFTGTITGGAFKLLPGGRGELKTASGTVMPTKINKTLTDNTRDQYISYGTVGILSSDQTITKKITVNEGGTLKGKGSVAGIEIETGGTLAPGDSPGCIISTGDLTLAGSYDVEINGATACTEYDQTDVTGAVDVTGGTLNVAILPAYTPALNTEFVIIKNDAADGVTGVFANYAQGARFDVAGVTYEVSYKGGDGNDVTLTAVAVPAAAKTPDTGVGSLLSSPFASLTAMIMVAGALYSSRKFNGSKK